MVFQLVHEEAPPGSRLPAETYEGRVNCHREGIMKKDGWLEPYDEENRVPKVIETIKEFLCWHQYIDWACTSDGFRAKEQWCSHCGKWRMKS